MNGLLLVWNTILIICINVPLLVIYYNLLYLECLTFYREIVSIQFRLNIHRVCSSKLCVVLAYEECGRTQLGVPIGDCTH